MDKDTCARATELSRATLAKSFRTKSVKPEKKKRSATIQAQVEDVVMKRVIPALIKAVRLEFDEEFEAILSIMVEKMRLEFDKVFRTFMPVMVEELSKKLNQNSTSRSWPHRVSSSISKSLKLMFVGTLPDTLLTLNNIQDQDASLMVELQDSSGSRVECGTEASVKIKIVVLHGEFEVDDTDDWTRQDFDKNVAQPRIDKGPLLKGKCEIFLSNGAASVTDIAFTDNSKCMRNGTFRLGARAVKGLPSGVEIRDAVSEAFRVKERRTKFYRKHKSPSLDDATNCLKNVGQTLYLKLAANGIHTVKDFLQLYHTDASKLQNILQVTDNKWSELIKNAESCSLSNEHYQYNDKELGIEVLLDCVFNIVRVIFNGKVNLPYGGLDDSQKGLANKIRLAAYEKRKDLRTCAPTIPTSMQAESISQSIIPHTQHLDATVADITPPLSCVNLDVNRMLKGQDMCRITRNSTDQREEALLPQKSSPGPNAGLELLSLMPSDPGMPIDQNQDSNCQHHSLNTSPGSPDRDSFKGADANMIEHCRLGSLSDTRVSSCGSNMLEIPMSQCNKRRRHDWQF